MLDYTFAGQFAQNPRLSCLNRPGPPAWWYYTFGASRVAMRQGSVVYYLHGDHLGSTSLTTNQSGALVSQARYLPYGEERWTDKASPTDFGFTSQRKEAGFGLYDYNARFYSPLLGRFISPDTMVPEPGGSQGWNRYSYVMNNPLKYNDPSGHCQGLSGSAFDTCATTAVIANAALQQINEDRQDVFFPDANTSGWDRGWAAARIGAEATLVGAVAAGGLALAGTQAVAATATSSLTAITGAVVEASGNFVGQMANYALTGQEINGGNIIVAGATGFAAGAIASFGATRYVGAGALGGLTSVTQYAGSQLNSGGNIAPEDVIINAGMGIGSGFFAGPVPPRVGVDPVQFSEFAANPALRNKAIMDAYSGQMLETVSSSGIARGISGATSGTINTPAVIEKACGQVEICR